MNKLLTAILPFVLSIYMNDDNSLVITHMNQGRITQTTATLSDYEMAVGNNNTINGIMDTINDLV